LGIKALVFDFDGLIFDTEEPEYLAWEAVYRSHGTKLEISEWLACVGTTQDAFDPIINLQARIDHPVEPDQVLSERENLFQKIIKTQTVMPGVEKYLVDARRLGLKLAVASSSSARWVCGNLEQLGLADAFDFICTSEDVDKVKPDPALYNCAIQRLGIQLTQAIAFEDSLNGLLAAKKAGLYCVAVPNSITKQLDFGLADIVLQSLEELSLTDLLARLGDTSSSYEYGAFITN